MIFKLPGKTQTSVVNLLNRLERKMGTSRFQEVFKSITSDNGCENLNAEGMEKSVLSKKQRTTVYYAHPYSAYERGANEGANVLIRRLIPKGTDIATLRRADIKRIAHDVVPNNFSKYHSLGFGYGMRENKLEYAFEICDYFRFTKECAAEEIVRMQNIINDNWKKTARQYKVPHEEINMMYSCFSESDRFIPEISNCCTIDR